VPTPTLLQVVEQGAPELAVETTDGFLSSAGLLGRRTAEMHLALASDPSDPAFAPEPISPHDQRALYQSLRAVANRTFAVLRRRAGDPDAEAVLRLEPRIQEAIRSVLDIRITAARIRIHGDFHLGQILYTGRDFTIIDFEGEPARPIGERRIKRLALVDVAGMIRSFDYAVNAAARELWYASAAGAFLREYLEAAGEAPFHPRTREELRVLLDVYLVEKALSEAAYEVDHRPDWLAIPAAGLLELLQPAAKELGS
jgi:maltose alpha-D-glucosyltransferase/alpha-amylase